MTGTGDADRIEIDPETLDRAARDLAESGGRLTDAATTAGSVTVSATAFGSMNSYLGDPIAQAARQTTELLRVSGDVVSALGAGARAAAADWRAYEDDVAQTFSAATVDLNAAREIL